MQIVSLNEEVRRALYGSERLSALDLDSYLPDLIGPSEILTDDYRKQLAKHLPARVEGTRCFFLVFILIKTAIEFQLKKNRISVDVGVQHVSKWLQFEFAVP